MFVRLFVFAVACVRGWIGWLVVFPPFGMLMNIIVAINSWRTKVEQFQEMDKSKQKPKVSLSHPHDK